MPKGKAFNLYYEMPEGGGNLEFSKITAALTSYSEMKKHYPDCYLCLTNEGNKVKEFIPARYR